MEDYEWDARSYMLAASTIRDSTEKEYRIEMAIASWGRTLELARSMHCVDPSRLVFLLLERAAAHLRLAALSFGTGRSKANFELASLDASAALEIDPLEPRALLLRARANIALACSDGTHEDAERDSRLRDAIHDLNIMKSLGVAAGNMIDVHAASTWANAARTIADRLTATAGLPFPDNIADVALLVATLKGQRASPSIANAEFDRRCEQGDQWGALTENGLLMAKRAENGKTGSLSVLWNPKQLFHDLRVNLMHYGLDVAFAACVLVLALTTEFVLFCSAPVLPWRLFLHLTWRA